MWHHISDIPKTDGLVSKQLLFVVDGIVYCGHYHHNGWFYNDAIHHKNGLFFAKGLKPSVGIDNINLSKEKQVKKWCYLSDVLV